MKIAVLGTGMVGQALSKKLLELDHEVYMGTRNAKETIVRTQPNSMTGISFSEWYQENKKVNLLDYSQLPDELELIINATQGQASIEALKAYGKERLAGKIIMDLSNGLDFSKGVPPTLMLCNTDSLGEQIQITFPDSFVVKSLNTMNCHVMVNPGLIEGDHVVFVCGNNDKAKSKVTTLLKEIGWKNNNIMDLGDITCARGTEMLLPIWLRILGKVGTPHFNFNIVRKE